MNFRWKDFFYFQKGDRNAIVILLLLIFLSGILVIHRQSLFDNQESYLLDNEFDKFQGEMNDIIISEPVKEEKETIVKSNTVQTIQPLPKLKQGETIDLNSCTIESLKRIPGVGEEYAKRIYDYKTRLGGFVSVGQLKEIQGFSGKRFDRISPYLVINKTHKKIRVNHHSANSLLSHPYLNERQVNSIIQVREQGEKVNDMEGLLLLPGFTPRDTGRLKDYVSFD